MSTTQRVDQSAPARLPIPENFPVAWPRPEDERLLWVHDQMHCPDPITPLDEEFVDEVYQGITSAAERYELGFRMRVRRINTYVYLAVDPILAPPDELAAQSKRSEAKLEAVLGHLLEIWRQEVFPEVTRYLTDWDAFNLAAASLPALLAHLDETVERHRRVWDLHFRIVLPKHVVISYFDDLYRDLFGDATAFDAYRLLQGFDNKTLEADRALWQLSRLITADSELRSVFAERPADEIRPALEGVAGGGPFLRAFLAYLDAYGRRGNKPFHVSEPSWIEDPSPALAYLKDDVARADRDPHAELAALAAEREELVRRARARLRGYPQPVVERFEHLLRAAQEAGVVSEDHNFWIDFRCANAVRRVLLACGDRLARSGAIDRGVDVFYLTLAELRESLGSAARTDRRRVVAGRRAEVAYFRAIRPPALLGTLPPEPPADTPLGRAWGKFLGVPPASPASPSMVTGNAGSPGVARGTARVLRSLADADRLQRGDVLVAPTTAAPWTPLFARAVAIVTDAGGILSHCAVVAREYRIPAVVGTGNATVVIRDGELVEVDGNQGIVRHVGSV